MICIPEHVTNAGREGWEEGKVLHHSGMKNWISRGQMGMDAVSMAISTHSSDTTGSELIKGMCGLVQKPSFTLSILSFLSGVFVAACCRWIDSPKRVGNLIRFQILVQQVKSDGLARRRRGFINHWSASVTRHFRF